MKGDCPRKGNPLSSFTGGFKTNLSFVCLILNSGWWYKIGIKAKLFLKCIKMKKTASDINNRKIRVGCCSFPVSRFLLLYFYTPPFVDYFIPSCNQNMI